MVDVVHGTILDDRRIKVREVALDISTVNFRHVQHILHTFLDMEKMFARWVP